MNIGSVFVEAVYRPTQIMIKHPTVLLANIYTSLVYLIYYSFFESFPRVYAGIYGFTPQQVGWSFVSIAIGTTLGWSLYLVVFLKVTNRKSEQFLLEHPSFVLQPALPASCLVMLSLFMFGKLQRWIFSIKSEVWGRGRSLTFFTAWTARATVHWIVSLLSIVIFACSVFIVLQCLAFYIVAAHPIHVASLFAGNDLCRSMAAAGIVVGCNPLLDRFSVPHSMSLFGALAGLLAVGCQQLTTRS